MPKDIKVKEKGTHSIRKLDRQIAFTSRVKRNLVGQQDKLQNKEEQTSDNINATNYATNKVIRGSDRGTRESVYLITDISKTTYKKVRMKLDKNKFKKDNGTETKIEDIYGNPVNNIKVKEDSKTDLKQERINPIKTRNLGKVNTNNIGANKKYQTGNLIKEKGKYLKIKQHSVRDTEIKENNNLLKIKTRDKLKDNLQLKSLNNQNTFIQNNLMKKSKIQELKKNTGKTKEITKKTGKVIVDIGKKIVKRTKRNGSVSSFWWRHSCDYYYDNCSNGRNIWICIWIFIFK